MRKRRYYLLAKSRLLLLFFAVFSNKWHNLRFIPTRGDKKQCVAICFGTTELITFWMIIHNSWELSMVVGPADSFRNLWRLVVNHPIIPRSSVSCGFSLFDLRLPSLPYIPSSLFPPPFNSTLYYHVPRHDSEKNSSLRI